MRARWELALIPPAILSAGLLVISQAMFLKGSLHKDLGLGRLSPILSMHNFFELVADSYYSNRSSCRLPARRRPRC
jgi:hypothetical protein